MALAPCDLPETFKMSTLDAQHKRAVRALLERDVPHNLFALSWLENYGITPARQGAFHFRGVFDPVTDMLEAVVLVISDRLILFDTDNAELASYLGKWYCEAAFHFQHIVSRRQIVEPFWQAYTLASQHLALQQPYTARLIANQRMFELTRRTWLELRTTDLFMTRAPVPLREADLSEIDAVFLASARMHREETGEDPLVHQPDVFRQHVRHRIQTGRTYVWFDEHRRLIFKVDISAQSRYGVQISGVYTDPGVRNQGIATRAMMELCRILFARGWPRATLYVNEVNPAALKVYERVGFRFHGDYMTIFVEHDEESSG